MSAPSPLTDDAIRARAHCILVMAQALVAETDRIAELLANLCDLDPSCEQITEAVWESNNPAEALMVLRGDLPPRGGATMQ